MSNGLFLLPPLGRKNQEVDEDAGFKNSLEQNDNSDQESDYESKLGERIGSKIENNSNNETNTTLQNKNVTLSFNTKNTNNITEYDSTINNINNSYTERDSIAFSTPLESHLRLPKINPDEEDYSKKYYYSAIQPNSLPPLSSDDLEHKPIQRVKNPAYRMTYPSRKTGNKDSSLFSTSSSAVQTRHFKSQHDIQATLSKPPAQRVVEDVELIYKTVKKLYAFEELQNSSKVKELCKIFIMEKFPANHTIFKQGEVAETFYIILRGSVRMSAQEETKEHFLVTLKKGEKFGLLLPLIQIDDSLSRTYTVTTCENTTLLRIEKDDYDRLLKFTHEKEKIENLDFLRKSVLFCSILPSSMARWAQHAIQRNFEENEVVYKRGAETDGLYFIRNGSCKILQEVQFSQMEKPKKVQVEICKIGPNEFFGEWEYCKKSNNRQLTVVSFGATILFVPLSDADRRIPLAMMEVMKQTAKTRYPDESRLWNLFQEKEKERQWVEYKKKLVDDILSKKKVK